MTMYTCTCSDLISLELEHTQSRPLAQTSASSAPGCIRSTHLGRARATKRSTFSSGSDSGSTSSTSSRAHHCFLSNRWHLTTPLARAHALALAPSQRPWMRPARGCVSDTYEVMHVQMTHAYAHVRVTFDVRAHCPTSAHLSSTARLSCRCSPSLPREYTPTWAPPSSSPRSRTRAQHR